MAVCPAYESGVPTLNTCFSTTPVYAILNA